MNIFEAIMHAERVNATLNSINNGDSTETGENALFISENTLENLVKSAGAVVEYLLDSTEETEPDEEGEYIEIPLDSYECIENLTNKQKGAVLKNIYAYFFNSGDMECLEDDAVKDATERMIARIKEYAENGEYQPI